MPRRSYQFNAGRSTSAEVRAHVDTSDGETGRDTDRIQADLLTAEEDARFDIVDVTVRADGFLDCSHDAVVAVLFAAENQIDAHDLASVDEPTGVILQAEDGRTAGGLINPDALEDASSIVQRMCQDMNLCILPVN